MRHYHPLEICDIRRETPECVSIAFTVPEDLKEKFRYIPGQFINLRTTVNGEELRRSYSICSSPSEGELRIAVKKIAKGRFSSFANSKLRVGDQIEVMPPSGNFYTKLDPGQEKTYVAIAAGSGITPVISIIKTTLLTESKSRFMLFFGNKSTDTIIFKDQLEALKNRFMDRLSIFHILSREKSGNPLFEGRIDEQKCGVFFTRIAPWQSADEVFICGPNDMIENVSACLTGMGVDAQRIHREYFDTPVSRERPARIEIPEGESRVRLKLDDHQFEFQMNTASNILDAAIEAGADLPFSCKGGVCSTCRAKLREGEVEMIQNYALEEYELDQGFVLVCQSMPKSSDIYLDFDEQ